MTERSSTQVRTFEFDLEARGTDETIPVVVSSDAVVEMHDGPEILVHTNESIDMQRAPLPIIASHMRGQVNIGVIDNLVVSGGKLRGTARFGSRQEAADYKADVLNRIIRSVSVGYARVKATVRNDGVLITSRWMPTHTALVAEPADINAGFFRSLEAMPAFEIDSSGSAERASATSVDKRAAVSGPGETTVSLTAAPQQSTEPAAQAVITRSHQMAENQIAAGQPAAEPVVQLTADYSNRPTAIQVERERRQAVQEMCKASNIDPRTEERWIMEGTPLNKVASEVLEVIEERSKSKPTSAAELGLSRKDQSAYSMFKVMRMLSAQNGGDTQRYTAEAAYEIECSRSVAKQLGRQPDGIFVPADILRRPAARALTSTGGSAGGYLVDTENMGFIDILRNRSVLSQMGARTLSGLQGNVSIPRQSGAGTMAWQAGETTAATAADQALGQYSLTPKTAIAVTEVGRTLMMQSSPSAESMVTADLARIVALGVDLAGLTGTGGAQPIGIENTPGVTTGQTATNATYALMLAFQGVAAAANAILGGPGYVTTPAVAAILMAKSRFANTDTPLWDGSISDGQLCGQRAMSSNQVTAGHCIFGSWNEMIIGEWGVLELTMNPYQSFNAGVVAVRAMYTVDILVRYPGAFVVSASVTT